MHKYVANALGVAGIAALCAIGWACVFHLNPALDAWGKSAPPDLAPTLARVNATLDAVNAPCTGFHGSVTCGALAQLSQTEKNVGIVAGQSALQVKQSGVLIDAAAQSVSQVTEHVNLAADSATSALAAVSVDLTSLQPSIKAVTPLLLSANDTVDDFDTLLKSHAVNDTLTNFDSMSVSGAGILANGKTVSDKITYDFTHPVPWYKEPGKIITLGFDAALLAK